MACSAAGDKKSGPAAAVTSLPNPLAFPDTTVGTVSDVRTTTFYNIGQLPLYFTNFQVPPDFAIVQNTCVTYVPVGGTCAISLVFRPTSAEDANTAMRAVIRKVTVNMGNPLRSV